MSMAIAANAVFLATDSSLLARWMSLIRTTDWRDRRIVGPPVLRVCCSYSCTLIHTSSLVTRSPLAVTPSAEKVWRPGSSRHSAL
jgi:hypothetical protein